ncbi:MAG: filamentous hemagglutinin N-terminal domain-containing protein [Verrucomicrobia bacterium]|nr:filamentous hemagglutinin N-terminal domain-containing protein [Verrucomicrobiota bacterium]
MKLARSLALVFSTAFLLAKPSHPHVVQGQVSIDAAGDLSVHAQNDKSIVHWRDFSIGLGEKVRFALPSKTAAILNRVTGGSPSLIEGLLTSNGQVFLINPHGIVISKDGVIDTASFLASTLGLSDKNFLEGNLLFEGTSTQRISIEGQVIASEGDAIFISHVIDKTGSVQAPQGMVGLAAGQRVIIHSVGRERITIIPTDSPYSEIGISNAGTIQAHVAELKADGNVYGYAINDTGLTQANQLQHVAGRIVLCADQGTAIASGDLMAPGGTLQVLGKHIYVSGKLDVSAPRGNGSIYVGGGRLGTDPLMHNAETVYVHPDAKLHTQATYRGSGGLVSIFGQEVQFYGQIDARGGPLSGNGGEVNIIGLKTSDIQGSIQNSAPQGYSGVRNIDVLSVGEPFESAIVYKAFSPPAPPPIDEVIVDIEEEVSPTFLFSSPPVINIIPGVQPELPEGFFYTVAFFSAEMSNNLKLFDGYVWLAPFTLDLQGIPKKTIQSSFDFEGAQREPVVIKKINYYQADRNDY